MLETMRDDIVRVYGTIDSSMDDSSDSEDDPVHDPLKVTVFAQIIPDGIGDISVTEKLLKVCKDARCDVESLFLCFGFRFKTVFDSRNIDGDEARFTIYQLRLLNDLSVNKILFFTTGTYANWKDPIGDDFLEWYKKLAFSE